MTVASSCDALVIGAGPAGSAAAWALARAGLDVVLVDQQSFPRDKVCGDALIPDALGAIETMGLSEVVEADSLRLPELRVYAPSGAYVTLTGDFRSMPRAQFDDVLVRAACASGARLHERTTAVAPLAHGEDVTGARLTSPSSNLEIRARVTLLATGANATAMNAFGLRSSLKPDAVAGRAYFDVPDRLASQFQHLCIAYERTLCPGYGWIFPGPNRRF